MKTKPNRNIVRRLNDLCGYGPPSQPVFEPAPDARNPEQARYGKLNNQYNHRCKWEYSPLTLFKDPKGSDRWQYRHTGIPKPKRKKSDLRNKRKRDSLSELLIPLNDISAIMAPGTKLIVNQPVQPVQPIQPIVPVQPIPPTPTQTPAQGTEPQRKRKRTSLHSYAAANTTMVSDMQAMYAQMHGSRGSGGGGGGGGLPPHGGGGGRGGGGGGGTPPPPDGSGGGGGGAPPDNFAMLNYFAKAIVSQQTQVSDNKQRTTKFMKSNLVLSAHDDEDLIAKTWAIVKYRNAFSVSEEQMFAHFTVENKHLKDPLRTYYLNLVNAQATDCPTTLNELILCAFAIWDWNPTYNKLNREFQALKMKEGTKPIYFYRKYILQMTQLERFRTQIRQW
ncbi:MAG: hypothetical protein GY938_27405, partial [Ketobacter sp.]|nr:hypothetical protein [Ketobacter sp.]